MKAAGYDTYMAGKWDLGRALDENAHALQPGLAKERPDLLRELIAS